MEIDGNYERDGAVCVRGAFSPEYVELAQRAIDANLASLSPRAKRASPDDDGAFVEDFCNWTRIPEMEQFIYQSGVGALAGELMRAEQIRLYHDHLLVKEASTRQRTPWHQDLPYYNVEGRSNISMWMPVDPVPKSSTLQCVAESHLGPWYMPRTFLDQQAKWFPEGSLAELPDIEAAPKTYRIVGWELEPGDAVFFHMLTLHSTEGTERRRRVLSLRFLGDDMVHAPRPWTTSPEFPGLVDELAPGAPLNHPLFPVLWNRRDSCGAERN